MRKHLIGSAIGANLRKTLLAMAAAALLAAPAFADNTSEGEISVTGQVIQSLEIAMVKNVTMPDVVIPDTGNVSTVTLTCDDTGGTTVTYSANGANPFADGNTSATSVSGTSANKALIDTNAVGECGQLNVTGEAGLNYAAVYTVTTPVPETGGNGVTISAPTCTSDQVGGDLPNGSSATLDAAGTDTLYCGATTSVTDQAGAIEYEGAVITVAVTYD